jgi:NAD(P)-dependent dehydrogenase (short-subunit alcohol dehydrogenase family)
MGLSISKDKPTDVKTKWFHDFEPTLPSLEGKTVAITGCTTGIGLVVAKACAKKNAKCVLMLNRPSARAEAAEEEVRDAAAAAATATAVETVPCDLQDFESVKKAAELIKSKYEAVDVLCNNAGTLNAPSSAVLLRRRR